MQEKNKNILIILFIVIMFSITLLPVNYPTDIYNILELDFKEYAKEWFAPAGRTIALILFFILDKVNISCNIYIMLMKFISIIIATITIYIFNQILLDLDRNASKFKRVCYLVASLATFLNRATYQFFYYTESAVMWLGVLFVILALKNTIQNKSKYKYIKTIIYLCIATNCYQSVILFYLPAVIILLGVNSKNIKEFWIDLLKNTLVVLINLFVGYIILKVLTNYYDAQAFRDTKFVLSYDLILNNICLIFWIYCDGGYNFILSYIYTVVIVLNFFLSKRFFVQKKSISILSIYLAIIISFMEVVGILSVIDFYCADRIQFAYISMIGLSFVYFLLYINTNKFEKILLILSIFYLSLNILNSNDITMWSRIVRERDENILNSIICKVEEYEDSTGIEIDRVEYCYDSNYVRCDYDIRKTLESTQRIMASEWGIDNAIKYTLKNDIVVAENQDIYSKVFKENNWDNFNIEEQIKFNDNIMYYCIY